MDHDHNYRIPGQLIQKLIDDRGWTQKVLAIVLGVDETGINKIIAGRRPVDSELALALSELFEVPAEKFMELQMSFDLAQARYINQADPSRAGRAVVFATLPIAEMIKRGWLKVDDIKDFPRVENEVKRFFGAGSIDEIEVFPHAAKKTLPGKATPAQLAWLYRVNKIAGEMLAPQYTPASGRAAVQKLQTLIASADEARRVPKILLEGGIRFAIVESLPDAKIDGVCFWLDASKPVIGLSLRRDKIDNFWFVLRHELEHMLRGHGQSGPMLDTELEGERAGTGEGVEEEERVANEAAAEFCVPRKAMDAFIARKAPLFSDRDVTAFARMLQVHPGLVVGQLHHRTGRYEIFNSHLTKVRSIVSPGSVVDGWGDIVDVDD